MATAVLYRAISSHQASYGQKLIEQLKPVERGIKVLDLGCGTGGLSAVWADLVGPTGSVVGVDPDTSRLQLARKQYHDKNNLTFYEGSTDNFPQDEYDVVFCNCVLNWVKNKRAAFTNVYQNVRRGGRFAFVVPEILMPMLGRLTDMMREEHAKALYNRMEYLSRQEYEELARSVGFKVEHSVSLPRTLSLDTENLLAYWKGTSHGAFDTAFIDEPVLSMFKEEHEGKIIESNGPVINMILVKL